MSRIATDVTHQTKRISTVSEFLAEVNAWRSRAALAADDGLFNELWFRGVRKHNAWQMPSVHRREFIAQADKKKPDHENVEDRVLWLERMMLNEFRTAGAADLDGLTDVEIYFVARHFGMPTRLLDWSANPLAALFFACQKTDAEKKASPRDSDIRHDGVIYAISPGRLIPENATFDRMGDKKLPRAVMSMRHPLVMRAVDTSFWHRPPEGPAYILPVRPDIVPGRIRAQASRFSLHMHGASDSPTDALVAAIKVPHEAKDDLVGELRGINVNAFTIYGDLDNLAKEIRRTWNVAKRIGGT